MMKPNNLRVRRPNRGKKSNHLRRPKRERKCLAAVIGMGSDSDQPTCKKITGEGILRFLGEHFQLSVQS
jgi:hypothetical protein